MGADHYQVGTMLGGKSHNLVMRCTDQNFLANYAESLFRNKMRQ